MSRGSVIYHCVVKIVTILWMNIEKGSLMKKANSANKHAEAILKINLTAEYKVFLNELKEKITSSRFKAAQEVNQQVIQLYWHIGKQIIKKQKNASWGNGLIESLSEDLRNSFPETKGFSATSLKRMRMFAEYYPNVEFGSQPVTQLPWGHVQLLLFKVKNEEIRSWYAGQCLENGWSRQTLEKYVKNDLIRPECFLYVHIW